MAELLAYAPTEPTAEIRKNPRGFPTVEEYAVSARESSRATAERRVAEITETSEDLKGLQGEFLSAEEIRSLIEGVESEKGILLASLGSVPEGSRIPPEVAEAVREVGREIYEIVKDAILPDWYEIPLYALPIAGEAAGANRLRKIAEAVSKVSKTLEKLKAAGGIKAEGAKVIENALRDLLERRETGKLGEIVEILRKGPPLRKELAEELAKTKELAETAKKAKMTETTATAESVGESLRGIGHRGRMNRLSEIFSQGTPSKETFAKAGRERLLEAEKYLDDALAKGWITPEARNGGTKDFLGELRNAAESHVGKGKVPEFPDVKEALRYLDSLKTAK